MNVSLLQRLTGGILARMRTKKASNTPGIPTNYILEIPNIN